MAGLLSKGCKLEYDTSSTSTPSWTEIPGLMEIPSMGSTPAKVDITTLADSAYQYINGIKDYGDLSFKFLYDNTAATSNFRVIKGFGDAKKQFRVSLPDNTTFTFSGSASADLDSAGVNAALTFTCQITLQSDIVVADPV